MALSALVTLLLLFRLDTVVMAKGFEFLDFGEFIAESSNLGSTHFQLQRVPIPVESIQVTIRIEGIHTGGKSGLNTVRTLV